MLSVSRRHDMRDREASESAYRRGQEAWRRSAGATVVNPFLPGTAFYKAFNLGAAEARDNAVFGKNTVFVSQPRASE